MGTTVGAYKIECVLGQGGMGVVYRAQDLTMDRAVALKVLPAEFSKDADLVKRFVREARLAGQITHPNLVRIYDVRNTNAGLYYIAMEFIEGATLEERVKQDGPLPIDEVVNYATQAARGLAIAHARGIVHRDIKPGNLMLEGGQIKLTDFGLATNAVASSSTPTGQIVGTPQYMSPEQIQCEDLDGRTDIYSLGMTAYYLATGEAPFKGPLPAVLMQHVGVMPPALHALRIDAPMALSAILHAMVRKDRHERFASAEDVVKALEHLAQTGRAPSGLGLTPDTDTSPVATLARPTEPALETPRTRKPAKRRLPPYLVGIATAVAVVAALALVGWGFSRAVGTTPVAKLSGDAPVAPIGDPAPPRDPTTPLPSTTPGSDGVPGSGVTTGSGSPSASPPLVGPGSETIPVTSPPPLVAHEDPRAILEACRAQWAADRIDEALFLVDRYLVLEPKDVAARCDRALLLRTLGRTQEHLAELARTTEIDPRYWRAVRLYGHALIAAGNAAQGYERLAASLVDFDPEAARVLAMHRLEDKDLDGAVEVIVRDGFPADAGVLGLLAPYREAQYARWIPRLVASDISPGDADRLARLAITDPDGTVYQMARAQQRTSAGDHASALDAWNRAFGPTAVPALKRFGHYTTWQWAQIQRGLTQIALGRPKDAIAGGVEVLETMEAPSVVESLLHRAEAQVAWSNAKENPAGSGAAAAAAATLTLAAWILEDTKPEDRPARLAGHTEAQLLDRLKRETGQKKWSDPAAILRQYTVYVEVAAGAGLLAGDRVIGTDAKRLVRPADWKAIAAALDGPRGIALQVERGGPARRVQAQGSPVPDGRLRIHVADKR